MAVSLAVSVEKLTVVVSICFCYQIVYCSSNLIIYMEVTII